MSFWCLLLVLMIFKDCQSTSQIIYAFDSNCFNSGTLYQTFYSCTLQNGASVSNGNVILQQSNYVSMDYAVTSLFGSNKQFTIELFGVSTGSVQSPINSEIFQLSSTNNANSIILYNNQNGYLSLGITINNVFFHSSVSSSFHSSSTRNYAVTIDLTNLQVTLFLAGIQILQIVLPNNAHQFSQGIYSGVLNGGYDNPSTQMTYLVISEVHLNSGVLSASDILQNHRDFLSQTKSPTSTPSSSPSPNPTILTSRPTKSPTQARSTHPPALILSRQPSSTPSNSPSAVPESSSLSNPHHQSTSSTAHSRSVAIIIPIVVILFLFLVCFCYYSYSSQSSKQSFQLSSFIPSFTDCFSSSSNYRPSLYQLTAQSKFNQFRHHFLPSGDCVICSSTMSHVFTLQCNHSICVEDLKSYLQAALNDSALFPLRCPMHCNGCTQLIPLSIPKQLLTFENFQKYQNLSDRVTYGEGVRCLRCSHYIPLPNSNLNKIYMIACPKCTLVFCLQCKLTSHQNRRCPVDVETELFEGWIERTGAMKCPGCNKLIEKEDDQTCNHMCHKITDSIPCLRERTDFCYCCGEEVLPTHPHDEVNSPGTNHFPQGVFQKCRVILEREARQQQRRQERQREGESLWNLTTTHIRPQNTRGNRTRSSVAVVPYE